jgi:hypothetical protein
MWMNRKRPSSEREQRNRRKKKAPAGPAKHAAKELPERPAMIAAARRRIGPALRKLAKRPLRWGRGLDRAANRGLERAHPPLLLAAHRVRGRLAAASSWLGPRLRPPLARLFRGIAFGERWARRGGAALARLATRASAVVTPRRATGAVIVAAGLCLVVSQFVDYRGVEIGQPGYAGLPGSARPPTVDVRVAGEAHGYLLVPLGAAAILLGLVAASRDRRRLGLWVAGLGLVAVAAILLVDLPRGLDVGAQSSRFAGATAVLEDGFYAELAAAAGLVGAGLLYYARPCRIRTNSSGRAASARRRRPRPPASSRARVARRA